MTFRLLNSVRDAVPRTQLLSNGRYAVMLSAAGSGYSRWGELAITRWREDATCDAWGSYLWLRDVDSGQVWSAAYQPAGVQPDAYEVKFNEDRVEFLRRDGTLTSTLEVVVSAESDAEVRRISISNTGGEARHIDLTSYAEIVLAPPPADAAHPAFSKMFVQTEFVPEIGAILATRRRRAATEPEVWAAHLCVADGESAGELQLETDRARFLGRARELRTAMAATADRALSGTVGCVLDPIFSLRHRLRLMPGATARVAFWTLAAPTRSAVLDLAGKHHDAAAFDRVANCARAQAPARLHDLGVTLDEANLFQRLAGHLLYSNPMLRPSSDILCQASGGQPALWAQGISGDLPIVLVQIGNAEDIDIVRQLLRACEYWRLKQLTVDLVVLNEAAGSGAQDLQSALESLVRTRPARPRGPGEASQGGAFILRSDIARDTRTMLLTAARAVLPSHRGSLAEQLERLEKQAASSTSSTSSMPITPTTLTTSLAPAAQTAAALERAPEVPAAETLEFFNGFGGFADNGREYVTIVRDGQCTPAPWVNVIANPAFGFQVSAEGAGYTWAGNSREHQLTPWSNDPVGDRPGEVIYLRDDESGALWGPTASPIRHEHAAYIARHGHGYSRFEHTQHGIALELLQFVPLDAPVKLSRLKLRNISGRTRRVSVTAFVEWVLGTSRAASAHFLSTEIDEVTGAMFARNLWAGADSGVAFVDLGGRQTSWTGDRTEFLGRNGTLERPVALAGTARLSGHIGGGFDPCAALQISLELEANSSTELLWLLGEAATPLQARSLITDWRRADLDAALQSVRRFWTEALGVVAVKTPDRALDLMLNGWLLYQTLACRLWARSAFYQASGAYGFRDQLQDSMAVVLAHPTLAREQLLRAAGRQFVEGDVQHWWLPQTGRGVRTHVSDDCGWLCFCAARYVEATGDVAVLDEPVPYLAGPAPRADEADIFFQPTAAGESSTLFEHCARALDHSLAVGAHGLPLMGSGDWNDGMNRVGASGRGESIWLGWFLCATLSKFIGVAQARGEQARAARWSSHVSDLRAALERDGWDVDWYRRAYFDDGTPLGSATNDECRIDSIAQSWAVLSGAADPQRARRAMAAVQRYLVRPDAGLLMLFTPAFDASALDPGYVKAYPPGIRENGGQYTHAAIWSIIAFAMLGDGDVAEGLFSMLNPINHARTHSDAMLYRVEPYVVCADVYSEPPHVGRGGWTWYTGSSGWMYRAGLEWILGCQVRGATLLLDPCVPRGWPGFEMTLQYRSTRYQITVQNPRGVNRRLVGLQLDGNTLPAQPARVELIDDGAVHQVRALLG